jgi:zinc protease
MELNRKIPPPPLEPIPFSVPPVHRDELDNGLRIVRFDQPRLPLFNIRLAFRFGDIHDPKGLTGLASAAASVLTEGTANYSSRALADKIERLGASLSASSSDDFTIISASGLSAYREDILDLLSEVVLRPTFPEDELDLYRRNTIEHLKFQRSQPNFLAAEQAARIIYGPHPYSTISPKASDVESLEREELVRFHQSRFVPEGATLIAVGDLGGDDFLSAVSERLGSWSGGRGEMPTFSSPPERTRRTLTVVDRPGSAQSNIVLCNLAVARNDPDHFAVAVMNQVLGAGASSRVFMNLREEKGYTYGAYTRFDQKRLAGDFEATAEVRTAVTGDSIREFFYELERIRDERVGDDELRDAKNFLTGVFPIRAETQEGLTSLIVNQELYELPDDYLQTYRENIAEISAEQVERVARKFIHPDAIAIVVVGDATEILQQTREFADDAEVFDVNGLPVGLETYSEARAAHAGAAGHWDLQVNFQGTELPVKMVLKQEGARVSGTIETALGSGDISHGTLEGDQLKANAVTELQGEAVELEVAATIAGDAITGSLTASMLPGPLQFSGRRRA